MFHGVFRFFAGDGKENSGGVFYWEFLPTAFGNKGRQKTES